MLDADLALAALAHPEPCVRFLAREHLRVLALIETERARRRHFAEALLESACQLEVLREGPEEVIGELLAERELRRRTYR